MFEFFTSKFLLFQTQIEIYGWKQIKFGAFFFRRFLNLNYYVIGGYSANAAIYKTTNHLRARIRPYETYACEILGLKIKCVGRFTRRQRSTSRCLVIGLVPLNTVEACIDYDSYGVVLDIALLWLKFECIK